MREDACEKFSGGKERSSSLTRNGDAWDDDEEEEAQQQKRKISRTKNGTKIKEEEENKEDAKELNVWDALLSSSDDDDDDDTTHGASENEEASWKTHNASMKKESDENLSKCQTCTYINHTDSIRCEMCGTLLLQNENGDGGWSTV